MTGEPRLAPCDPDPALPPFFKEGLLAFVHGMTRQQRPVLLDRAALRAMSEDKRDAYDEARKDWHANLGPYATPAGEAIVDELWEVVDSNRQTAEKVKPCVAVQGLAGTGKTTTLLHFAKRYHLAAVKRHGAAAPSGGQRLPVCVTTLGGNETRLGFNRNLLSFYGWPYPKKSSADDLTPLVHAAVLACGTELIVVDDIDFIRPTTADGMDVSKHMKSLSSRLPVTFVFGGIEIDTKRLLTEGRTEDTGKQSTARRWTLVDVEPFAKPVKGRSDDDWTRLLKAMERDVVLARSYQGMLYRDCRDVLWDKTGGNLASLTNLMRRACHRAVSKGTERLDPSMIAGIRGDSTAQRQYEGNGGLKAPLGTSVPGERVA